MNFSNQIYVKLTGHEEKIVGLDRQQSFVDLHNGATIAANKLYRQTECKDR